MSGGFAPNVKVIPLLPLKSFPTPGSRIVLAPPVLLVSLLRDAHVPAFKPFYFSFVNQTLFFFLLFQSFFPFTLS